MTEQERQLVQMLRDDAGPIRPNGFLDAADVIERLAAEVERLRAGGCARDQRTTQYCAEAVRLQAEIERLIRERDQANEERDDARRQYCRGWTDFAPNPRDENLSLEDAAMAVAERFGWDCFKEASR